MRKKIEIIAVKYSDLRGILNQYSLAEKIENGELMCRNCSETLTWNNIGGFVVARDTVRLFCDNPDCIEESKRENSNE